MAYSSVLATVLFSLFSQHFLHARYTIINTANIEDSAEEQLSRKFQAMMDSLADREDANVMDVILETNRGLGLNLFEGDIKDFSLRRPRSAVRNHDGLWPFGIVPYVIDSSIEPEVANFIHEAIAEYHALTCVRWVPRTSQNDYINFTTSSGCFSSIGRVGSGPQELSLTSPCAKTGTAMHEMLHALGFFHEHSRPDRDFWVEILLQNVLSGKESDFDRLPEAVLDNLDIEYDYSSILHYSRYAFSANGQPTLLPKQDPNADLGQRNAFSHKDLLKINKLYHCDIQTTTEQITLTHAQTPSLQTSQPVTQIPIGWSPWSTWSDCDLQCRHSRFRLCQNNDLVHCPGSSTEEENCLNPCRNRRTDGGWGAWSEWGQCSRLCGTGRMYRYRRCDSPSPAGQGQPCAGQDAEVIECNTQTCQAGSKCGMKKHKITTGGSGYINVLDYDNLMTCEYVIETAAPNATISLAVTRLDIEPSLGCSYDSLTIYDGHNDSGQYIGTYCGSSPVAHVQSSGQAVFIRFQSDSSTTGGGFSIKFSSNSDTRKTCGRVLPIAHGSTNGSNFAGDMVVFSCDPGYHLVGAMTVTCVDQPGIPAWSDNFPSCVRNHRKRRESPVLKTKTCNFEGNFCGFHRDVQSRSPVSWKLAVDEDTVQPPLAQRPLSQGSSRGHVLFVESTHVWRPFDSARLTSQHYYVHHAQTACLTFWYRCYGNNLVKLNVLQASENGEKCVWSVKGQPSAEWTQAKVVLLTDIFMQFTFEAAIGQQLGSSAAIDDVIIFAGSC